MQSNDQILQLANQTFGNDYLSEAALSSYINSETSKVIVQTQGQEVVGFSIVVVFKSIEASNHLFMDLDSLARDAWFGYRKMTIVKPEFQGKGIGSQLIRQGEAFIRSKSKTVYSSIWCNGSEEKMTKLLHKNGYQFIDRKENYWQKDSLMKQYDCAICGNPPCKCAALIYKKNLILPDQ